MYSRWHGKPTMVSIVQSLKEKSSERQPWIMSSFLVISFQRLIVAFWGHLDRIFDDRMSSFALLDQCQFIRFITVIYYTRCKKFVLYHNVIIFICSCVRQWQPVGPELTLHTEVLCKLKFKKICIALWTL